MRVHVRAKFAGLNFFAMLSHYQTLKGITSKIGEDRHVILWDLESYTQKKQYVDVKKELLDVQRIYDLSTIYVFTDKPKFSWRAFCWKTVPFRTYMKILLDTASCDWNFIYWTMHRGESTIRISRKTDRPKQFLFDVLPSYDLEIPEGYPAKIVTYDTGIDKKGRMFKIERRR